MASLRFQEHKEEFIEFDSKKQQQLFALSCFQSSHLEAGFPGRIDDIKYELKRLLQDLYGDNPWKKIKSKDGIENILDTFEQGDAMNYMLEWYLDDEFPNYYCISEQHNDRSQFDVTILEQGISICGIELKRAGSSNRVSQYLKDHQEMCGDIRTARNYLLVNLFPITNKMDSVRTFDLVDGYGYLSSQIYDFYAQDNSHVANIPAPIFKTDEGIEPLNLILDVLKNDLNM